MSNTAIQIGRDEDFDQSGFMRAGVYRGEGRVVVEHVPIPEIGEGEVLFRVAACGICGTDIKKIHHGFIAPPQILGHELAGTVVKVGRGVYRFKPGDRVVSFHHIPCGACFYCEKKLFSQCASYKKTGLTAGFEPNGGGFAEYVRAMPWIVEMTTVPPADSAAGSGVTPAHGASSSQHSRRPMSLSLPSAARTEASTRSVSSSRSWP